MATPETLEHSADPAPIDLELLPEGRELEGRVALITGAARGIGRATAAAFARQGAHVVALDVAAPLDGYPQSVGTAEQLQETVDLVGRLGGRALSVQADVRDTEAVGAAISRTTAELGRLDIVVANAGIAIHAPLREMTDAQWDAVLGVNLLGAVKVIRAAIPHMAQRRFGRIVAISSVGGRGGTPGVISYAASKWALIGMIKTAALELARDGITANIVAPTSVDTPLYRSDPQYRDMLPDLYAQNLSFAERDRQVGEWVAANFNAIPVPYVQPEDIANATVFLTTERARYITGEVLDVAAGANAHHMA
jgi:NAD(P)-dependent dehydrogenase (short-subunit alcohol dehydrogenase family)